MKVKDVMTKKLIVLKPHDKLETAMKLFSRHKIRGCPVVSSGRVVGMITQADIMAIIDVHSGIQQAGSDLFSLVLAVIKEGEEFDGLKGAIKKVMKMPVKDFMKTDVVKIDIDEDVYTAARMMHKNSVSRLPVVQNGKIKGTISMTDIVNVLAKMK